MRNQTGVEITTRALDFLSKIKDATPVEEFVKLELTGDHDADLLLSSLSLMLLKHLRDGEFVKTDEIIQPGAKIYGLTTQGIEMHRLFLKLSMSGTQDR